MMAENGHSVEIDGKKIQMTIVQEAVETKLDYSHLVGKWVKCLEDTYDGHEKGYFYPVSEVQDCFVYIDNGNKYPVCWNGKLDSLLEHFDLSNPLDHNPDDVRVFDVPSEIKISIYDNSLNLHFGEHQCLVYNKEKHCYGVFASSERFEPIPCIATGCKFEDLQEGDLFFATDDEKQDFARLRFYNFLSIDNGYVWTDGRNVNVLFEHKYTHYFKITPKP